MTRPLPPIAIDLGYQTWAEWALAMMRSNTILSRMPMVSADGDRYTYIPPEEFRDPQPARLGGEAMP